MNAVATDLQTLWSRSSILPLRLHDVGLKIGQQVLLNAISLSFEAGSRNLILGPNGAGKSLLLRLCHGLIQPTSGRISWALSDKQQLRQSQAMVFQRPVMLRRSVLANITYALAQQGIEWRRRRSLAHSALEQVGLDHLANRPARVLSGGEQQRVALARAWALQPQVLFLDEPTANLDPGATRRIESIINAIHDNGTTLIMTTHDLGQARRHADHIMFLHRGQMLEQQSADSFFAQPKSEQARNFLAGELVE